MATAIDSSAMLRLLQLTSPSLPIGAFAYSQGMEWAVECGWLRDRAAVHGWLLGLLHHSITLVEIPVFARLYHACEAADPEAIQHWSQQLVAMRESQELRSEECNRAQALTRLLIDLGIERAAEWEALLGHCQHAPYALATVIWEIPLQEAALGVAWGWLENQVAAAIKLVPLGQTEGQRLLMELAGPLADAVEQGLQLEDEAIGGSAPALAIASSLHETQYTRLFRS